jgi:hypothetical protein
VEDNPPARGAIMRAAKSMSAEMVDQLFEEFKKDRHRWAEFERRELALDTYSKDNIEPTPGRVEIVGNPLLLPAGLPR